MISWLAFTGITLLALLLAVVVIYLTHKDDFTWKP